MKSKKTAEKSKKIPSGKECEVMNYLPYFKEPPINTIKRYNIIAFVKDFERIGIQIAALRSVCKIRAQIVDCAFVKFGCFVRFRFQKFD